MFGLRWTLGLFASSILAGACGAQVPESAGPGADSGTWARGSWVICWPMRASSPAIPLAPSQTKAAISVCSMPACDLGLPLPR